MSNIYFVLIFTFVVLLIASPLSFLMVIMMAMMTYTLVWFTASMDYWSTFMMILIFLVGLLLLYVYLLSLSSKSSTSKNFSTIMMLISTFLMTASIINDMYMKAMSNTDPTSQNCYDWVFESKTELILLSMLWFTILIVVLYFFVKGMKKMMKSSK